ncbi:MAG: hypothetical protein ACRELY_03220, partial [Polyangiaceae bacterium]
EDLKTAGTLGGKCYGNGTCNGGLICLGDKCIASASDGGGDDATAGDKDATAKDAATDSGPFTVANVPGLVFWVYGSSGLDYTADGGVTGWEDYSGHDNSAISVRSPGPAYVPSTINGLPGIQVSPSTTDLEIPINDWTSSPLLVEVVEVVTSASSPGIIFGSIEPPGSTGTPAFQLTAASGPVEFEGSSFDLVAPASFPVNDGLPHVIGIRHSWVDNGSGGTGSSIEVRYDGALANRQTFPEKLVFSDTTCTTHMGVQVDGIISEVIAVKGSTSDASVAAIESYLKTKYDL